MAEYEVPFLAFYDARLDRLVPYDNSIEPGHIDFEMMYLWSSRTQLFGYLKYYTELYTEIARRDPLTDADHL